MRATLIIGLSLLGISAPPLFLMAREVAIGSVVTKRYPVERIVSSEKGMESGALRAEVGGHVVELVDNRPVVPEEPFKINDAREPGSVSIRVDGRVVSTPVKAIVRLHRQDANRYWGYVYLMRVVDREGPERLVVAQNLGQGEYRTVSVFADGNIIEDKFTYGARCSPPIRAELIRSVVPHPSGYCSDVMQVWPSLFYPILYPWFSGLAGFMSLGLAGVRWCRRRARGQPLRLGSDA
jgi:hypothetical protein